MSNLETPEIQPINSEIFSLHAFNQRQRELAVEKSFPGKKLEDLTSEERNIAMINWTKDKMSAKYRALTDHENFKKIPRFAEGGYSAITLKDVEDFDLDKRELLL